MCIYKKEDEKQTKIDRNVTKLSKMEKNEKMNKDDEETGTEDVKDYPACLPGKVSVPYVVL